MNIQNLREDYINIIKESENAEIKDYIKQIVEEVLSEMERGMETSSESKAAYKLLKDYGYKSFGSKRALNVSFSKLTSEGDDHRVYVNRDTGKWEFGSNKSLGIKMKSGTSLKELESLLKDVDSKIKEMKNVSEEISEAKDPSAEIKKELKKAGYELVGKSNALVQTYSKIWQDNPNYVNSHKISVDTVNGTWKALEDKKLKLGAAEGETMNLKSYLDKAAKGMKTK